jgi:hypothetical protein
MSGKKKRLAEMNHVLAEVARNIKNVAVREHVNKT